MKVRATAQAAPAVRWFYLAVGSASMFFAGIIYAWSILNVPLASEFGWDASELALNFTFTLCFFCIGGVISSQLARRTSPKIVLCISAAATLTGFSLCSFMEGNILVLYLAYGLLTGTGIGMSYNSVISSVSMWFPDKKGLCAGILMMSFGVSSLVLGKGAEFLFAQHTFGWRKTYLLMGISLAVVLIAAAAFIRRPDTELSGASSGSNLRKDDPCRSFTPQEMLRRLSFWKFFLVCILTASVGSTVISFARDLALSMGAQAALASTMVGILSICNGLGRIFCGFLFDALGRRKTMLISNLLTIVAPVIVLASLWRGSLLCGIAGLCCTGICYGCCPTISSAFISEFYGMEFFPTNYSIANLMLIPCSFAAPLASSLLTFTGSYVAPFLALLAFAAAAFILNLTIRKP